MDPHYHLAVNILVKKDSDILLSRRANTGWNDGMCCAPGGHVEKNETPRQAAIREANEELGLDIELDDLEFLCTEVRLSLDRSYISCIYVLQTDQTPRNTEPGKCSELLWVDPNNLPEDIIPNFKQIIEKAYVGGETYLEYLQA